MKLRLQPKRAYRHRGFAAIAENAMVCVFSAGLKKI